MERFYLVYYPKANINDPGIKIISERNFEYLIDTQNYIDGPYLHKIVETLMMDEIRKIREGH